MNRRQLLLRSGAAAVALGLSRFPRGWAGDDKPKRRILMYTKSEAYEHDVVKRKGGELSLAEKIVTDLGKKHGFEVNCTKDGRVFANEDLGAYDAFLFETQGDPTKEGTTDKQPPMPEDGKRAFLRAVAAGKGFVGCHCASDTFHSPGDRAANQAPGKRDEYIAMLGGEFIRHGAQQKGRMQLVDPGFPGAKGLVDFAVIEEWYSLKNFAPDLHVILVQDTKGMTGLDYQRPNFPATWARMHRQGRVFYTSMGHRADVWQNPSFQDLLLGGLFWAVGNVEADVNANMVQVTPKANDLPPLRGKS